MKNFHHYGLFGLIGILALVLVFLGINLVQAGEATPPKTPPGQDKKDKEETVNWSVTLPGDDLFAMNNNNGSYTFTENDFVSVGIGEPNKDSNYYRFTVRVNRPQDKIQGLYGIDFKKVGIGNAVYGDGTPCVLPGLSEGCFATKCDECIATFLNSTYPTDWYHPYDTYLSATVQVQVEAQAIDDLKEDIRTVMPADCGVIYISISNGYPYLTEDTAESEWHEVFGFTDIIENGLYITKNSDGGWVLEIVNHPLELKEVYMVRANPGRGNTGNFVTPLEVTTTPVSFQMQWNKLQ